MLHRMCLLLAYGLISLSALTVRGESGTSKAISSIIADEPNLPIVFLEPQGRIASEPRVPCAVKIAYPKGVEPGVTGPLSGMVRFHGASSQMYPKKSFGIVLDAPEALLQMRQSAHWILNAAYIDRSLMRHKLAYDLFRSLSKPGAKRYAAASRFVEVDLKGSYRGVYLLMERVDRQLLELGNYNSNDLAHACIYKAIDHAANFGRRGHAGYEQREPDPLTSTYWQPLDEFNQFASSSSDTEFFHPQTGIASRLDLENAIDFHLLVLVTANKDGITKNFILARNRIVSGSPNSRFFFAPWDYDGTFGRDWNAMLLPPRIWLSNHLFDRLLGNAAYRTRFAARWNELRQHEFSAKTIQNMIDTNAQTLGDAPRRNAACWPTISGPYPDALTFSEDIMQMKNWVEARIQWLDQEINRRTGH
jgi:spore coat protein H